MVGRSLNLTDKLYQYMLDHSLREPQILQELREETGKLLEADWQTSPEQTQLITLIAQISGAVRVLEIGTFTGYTTLWMALSLSEGGHIVTIEPSEQFAGIARSFWEKAGVADRIDLRLSNGVEGLKSLLEESRQGTFDLAYIDADKPNYPAYYEDCHSLVRVGGLILIDNVFRYGRVVEAPDRKRSTRIMRELNRHIYEDDRVQISMVPIGDGLTIARKIK